MLFNENAIKNKIQTYKMKVEHLLERIDEWRKESLEMSKEDKLDEAIDESYPASDAPAHRSKSQIDRTH